MRKLDRSRSFGEVVGASSGARYFQDDLAFDAQENEIVTGAPAAPAKAKKPAAPKALSVDAQLASQMEALA